MVDVQPLRALRYTQEKVGNLSQVITPPYDVISPDAQVRYYERSPYNSIRLELGQAHSSDNSLNTVYTRAAATFAEWRLQGILYQQALPCYYLYQQRFSHDGRTYTRTSLLARVRLEPWSARVVLPHEYTLQRAKDDRLNLYRACATNFSPIMSVYDDPQGHVRHLLRSYATHPEVHVVDEQSEEHLLQPISDPEHITHIHDFFTQRQLYIADGHHRYETALAYRQEILEQRKELFPDDGVNFTLMALIDIEDPGLLVLPTHRLLFGLREDVLANLSPTSLGRYFAVHVVDTAQTNESILHLLAEAESQQPTFVVSTQEQTVLLQLNQAGKNVMESSGHSPAWNSLAVAIAQRLLLQELLGLTEQEMAAGTHVRYSHDAQQVFQAVQNGEAQAALLLHATPLRQVSRVAQADDRLPQKSTYLYPKLTTGLVMNPLW